MKIEHKKSMKVRLQKLSQSRESMCKIKNRQGKLIIIKEEIAKLLEMFYSDLYKQKGQTLQIMKMSIIEKQQNSLWIWDCHITHKKGGYHLKRFLRLLFYECLMPFIMPWIEIDTSDTQTMRILNLSKLFYIDRKLIENNQIQTFWESNPHM